MFRNHRIKKAYRIYTNQQDIIQFNQTNDRLIPVIQDDRDTREEDIELAKREIKYILDDALRYLPYIQKKKSISSISIDESLLKSNVKKRRYSLQLEKNSIMITRSKSFN